MSTHPKEFLCWFDEWASRFGLNKTTRNNLLRECEDIDGILFLANVANSSDDEVSRFASSESQKSALRRAFAELREEDNAKFKTDTRPFGIKASNHLGSSTSARHQHNSSFVLPLKPSQAARNSNSEEKRDWSCGLCGFIRANFGSDAKCSQLKKAESFYDCFECNKSFCQQNELTNHICQVH